MSSVNQSIADQLEALARSLAGQRDQKFRTRAYFNAADGIRKHPEEIKSGEQAERDIRGVGKTTAERIDEFLASGSVTLESRGEARTPDLDKDAVIIVFTKIYGVGPKTAEKWYQQGYRSLDQLASLYLQMTSAQQLGYQYYLHLQFRISRDEIDLMTPLFEQVVKDYKFLICGSYRRGHRTSGDIDLLIEGTNYPGDNERILAQVVGLLVRRNFILGALAHKNNKFMGICRLSGKHNVRRIDILVTPPKNWAAASLYFTGSKELNILMREAAQLKGMRLLSSTETAYFRFFVPQCSGISPIHSITESLCLG